MKIKIDPQLTASKIDQNIPYPLLKRVFDFILSAILIIITSPLLLAIFLLTKIEGWLKPAAGGPFFYQETRISQGQPFNFYKIRIYKVSALKDALAQKGFIHTKDVEKNPDNLTAIGQILKKFYLDELPQIFNVLKGEMSLVGTRPWNTAVYQREIKQGIFRKKILKAGLTGLVQITKGQHQLYGGDQALDDYYLKFCREHSAIRILFLDIKIIFLSIIKMFQGQGL